MGAGLVKAAYRAAGAVKAGHAPTRAFAFMAVTALDHDARPLYWGRDALALALGKGPTTAGYRAVEEALRALRKLKLVEVARPSAPERPARYALLDGRGSPLQPLTDAQGSHVGVIEERESDAHDSADQRPRTSRPTPKDQPTNAQGSHVGRGGRGERRGGEEGAQRNAPRAAPPRFSEQEPRAEVPHVPESADSKNAGDEVTARTGPEASPVPESVAAAVSPFCRNHPEGTDKPCRPCGIAYVRWKESERAKPQSVPSPTPSLLVSVQPDSRCAPGTHELSGDPPGCSKCPVRPWELEEEERGSTVRSTAAVAKPPKPPEPPEHPEPSTLASVLARMP